MVVVWVDRIGRSLGIWRRKKIFDLEMEFWFFGVGKVLFFNLVVEDEKWVYMKGKEYRTSEEEMGNGFWVFIVWLICDGHINLLEINENKGNVDILYR